MSVVDWQAVGNVRCIGVLELSMCFYQKVQSVFRPRYLMGDTRKIPTLGVMKGSPVFSFHIVPPPMKHGSKYTKYRKLCRGLADSSVVIISCRTLYSKLGTVNSVQ
jgi:hypothetical protein